MEEIVPHFEEHVPHAGKSMGKGAVRSSMRHNKDGSAVGPELILWPDIFFFSRNKQSIDRFRILLFFKMLSAWRFNDVDLTALNPEESVEVVGRDSADDDVLVDAGDLECVVFEVFGEIGQLAAFEVDFVNVRAALFVALGYAESCTVLGYHVNFEDGVVTNDGFL
jgi:hypothetical protein